MSGTFKVIELVGTSEKGFSDAARNAISDAGLTIKKMSWFEVIESRGNIMDNDIVEYQVKVKIAFKVEKHGG